MTCTNLIKMAKDSKLATNFQLIPRQYTRWSSDSQQGYTLHLANPIFISWISITTTNAVSWMYGRAFSHQFYGEHQSAQCLVWIISQFIFWHTIKTHKLECPSITAPQNLDVGTNNLLTCWTLYQTSAQFNLLATLNIVE